MGLRVSVRHPKLNNAYWYRIFRHFLAEISTKPEIPVTFSFFWASVLVGGDGKQRGKYSEFRKEQSSMAVLKAPPKQPKTTVVQLRLDDEVKLKLAKYAEFLDCSPSYVVTEALKLVYRKDKEFQSWLSGQHTKVSEPTSKGDVFQLELK
jgi:hypothetical protein